MRRIESNYGRCSACGGTDYETSTEWPGAAPTTSPMGEATVLELVPPWLSGVDRSPQVELLWNRAVAWFRLVGPRARP